VVHFDVELEKAKSKIQEGRKPSLASFKLHTSKTPKIDVVFDTSRE
jgi:hypothetical protein